MESNLGGTSTMKNGSGSVTENKIFYKDVAVIRFDSNYERNEQTDIAIPIKD